MKKILIISGLDPSGNAGLIRDLEVISSFDLKPACIVTALTAQNGKFFLDSQIVSQKVFTNQLLSVLPFSQYQAIKIGMLGNGQIVKTISACLKKEKKRPRIVLDPVMTSSTGGMLLDLAGRKVLWRELLPLVTLWTPNLAEATFFYGKSVKTPLQMEKAGNWFVEQKGIPVLIKGGHLQGKSQDLLVAKGFKKWMTFPRIKPKTQKFRGTGCALSTLIAFFLAEGFPLDSAVVQAREVMQSWLLSQQRFFSLSKHR